jgi:hypothetical protein
MNTHSFFNKLAGGCQDKCRFSCIRCPEKKIHFTAKLDAAMIRSGYNDHGAKDLEPNNCLYQFASHPWVRSERLLGTLISFQALTTAFRRRKLAPGDSDKRGWSEYEGSGDWLWRP